MLMMLFRYIDMFCRQTLVHGFRGFLVERAGLRWGVSLANDINGACTGGVTYQSAQNLKVIASLAGLLVTSV